MRRQVAAPHAAQEGQERHIRQPCAARAGEHIVVLAALSRGAGGTRCSFATFIRPAGTFAPRSISSHLAPPVLAAVRMVNASARAATPAWSFSRATNSGRLSVADDMSGLGSARSVR
jgi:hypothetical protein